MTRAREAALAILKDASQPLSASGIANALRSSCDQATVYRSLHYLESAGLAESFILHCAVYGTERYWTLAKGHRHWFHCQHCHRFTELSAFCPAEEAAKDALERGLKITGHVLYFTGICDHCSSALAKAQALGEAGPS